MSCIKNSVIAAFFRYNRWALNQDFYSYCSNSRDILDAKEILIYSACSKEKEKKQEAINIFEYVLGEVEYCIKRNWIILDPTHLCYPQSLFYQDYPPVFLTVMGDANALARESFSVVGGREPTLDAKEWMENEFQDFLRCSKLSVISGGARGIDMLAHMAAIRNSCSTIALMPSGLKNIYPPDFSEIISEIIMSGGCIVSEYLPSEEIKKFHFHERNRLISNLGFAVLVVQAKMKSGSLLTANHALSNGKDVLVVPWSAREAKAYGSNQLLFNGAQLIRDGQDLMSYFLLNGFIFKEG